MCLTELAFSGPVAYASPVISQADLAGVKRACGATGKGMVGPCQWVAYGKIAEAVRTSCYRSLVFTEFPPAFKHRHRHYSPVRNKQIG